jgi:hypothetical protein
VCPTFGCIATAAFDQTRHNINELIFKTEVETKKKTLPWLLVRKRTIPSERLPQQAKLAAKHLRVDGVAWPARRVPTAVNLGYLDPSSYFSFK